MDFANLGKAAAFENSAIAKEFFLESDAPRGGERDPLAVNKAYRDLRNLRVHHAISLVVRKRKTLLYDLADSPNCPNPRQRWFLRPIQIAEHGKLTKPQLSLAEVSRFNEWLGQRTLGEVVYQHLMVLSMVIGATEKVLV